LDKIGAIAKKRSWADRNISPVLSWTNEELQKHVDACAAIPGAKLLWGGSVAPGMEKTPKCYGTYLPTAVHIPIE